MPYSAAEAGIQHYGNTNALVEPNGDVLWVPPGHFKAYCKMNMRQWPFDTQVCQMKFGSWTSHGNLIKLGLYRNSTYVEQLNVYTDNRQWKIIGKITAEHKQTFYDCCDEPYPDVTFTFNLQRDSQGYRAIVILPCLGTKFRIYYFEWSDREDCVKRDLSYVCLSEVRHTGRSPNSRISNSRFIF